MLTTTNYALKKPEGTDVVDIQNFNDNADIIDAKLKEVNTSLSDLVYQTAGGTATTITLTMQTLVTGYAKTFIASANNSGVATTINGKPLYKPGTTTAPTLIAGKAYTVWYNSASLCFFIKASAEGNTIASHVLAGDSFSNDTDTELIGLMPNNGALNFTIASAGGTYTIPAGYTSGGIITAPSLATVTSAGTVTNNNQILNGYIAISDGVTYTGNIPSKATATYNPSTSVQTIASGQYLSGIQTIAATTGTANVDDVVAGKTFNSASGIGQTGTATIASLGGHAVGETITNHDIELRIEDVWTYNKGVGGNRMYADYVGGYLYTIQGDGNNGTVCKLNTDGVLQLSFSSMYTSGIAPLSSGYLYEAGNGNGGTPSVFYRNTTGVTVWSITSSASNNATITTDDTNMYIGTTTGYIMKYGQASGTYLNLWSVSTFLIIKMIYKNSYLYCIDSDSILRKVSLSGSVIWSYDLTSSSSSYSGIAVDSNNNVYVTATTYVKKINSSGALVWSKTTTVCYGVTVDSSGYIYTGHTGSITAYNPTGDLLWQRSLLEYSVYGITTDSSGNVYYGIQNRYLYKLKSYYKIIA